MSAAPSAATSGRRPAKRRGSATAQWPRQDAVDFGEQVLDVAPVGHGLVDLTVPLGVGIAQKPVVRAPRNCMEDALLRTHERPDRIGIDERGTIRCTPFDGRRKLCARPVASSSSLSVPTPTATIVCRARSSRGRPASESLARTPTIRPVSSRRKSTARALVTIDAPWRRSAGHVDCEERIILLASWNCTPRPANRAEAPAPRPAPSDGEMPRPREVPARPGVVEEQAGPDVESLPAPVLQGEQELDRLHEVGASRVSSRRVHAAPRARAGTPASRDTAGRRE